MIFGFVGLVVIVVIARVLHHQVPKYKGLDVPNYASFVKYIHSIIDFWTDLLFVYSMYLNNNMLYCYLSLIFTICPLIFSVLLVIYYVYHWRTMVCSVSHRLADYFAKYSIIFICLTIMTADFYSSIMLLQSKLFHLSMFNLQLKKRESQPLILWKFLSNNLMENIPQLIIQASYVFINKNNKNGNDSVSLLVFFSLILNILSIISSIVYFIVTMSNILVEYNENTKQITEFETTLTIKCDKFNLNKNNAFISKFIEKEILKILRKRSKTNNLWNYRKDVRLQINVFYIENDIKLNNEINVFFDLVLFLH